MIHIVKLDDDRESAFLIQDMFPITKEYIERGYIRLHELIYFLYEYLKGYVNKVVSLEINGSFLGRIQI